MILNNEKESPQWCAQFQKYVQTLSKTCFTDFKSCKFFLYLINVCNECIISLTLNINSFRTRWLPFAKKFRSCLVCKHIFYLYFSFCLSENSFHFQFAKIWRTCLTFTTFFIFNFYPKPLPKVLRSTMETNINWSDPIVHSNNTMNLNKKSKTSFIFKF